MDRFPDYVALNCYFHMTSHQEKEHKKFYDERMHDDMHMLHMCPSKHAFKLLSIALFNLWKVDHASLAEGFHGSYLSEDWSSWYLDALPMARVGM